MVRIRDYRRHQRQRRLKRFTNIVRYIWHNDEYDVVKCFESMPVCSCWMCGNPRKQGKRTRKELW